MEHLLTSPAFVGRPRFCLIAKRFGEGLIVGLTVDKANLTGFEILVSLSR